MSRRAILVVLIALVLAAAAAVAAAFAYDQPFRETLLAAQGKGWKKSAEAGFYGGVRKWGDWPWLMAGGGAALALAMARRNRRWTQILAAALIASTLAGLVANMSRLTTGRTRPRASPRIEQGFYGPWRDGKFVMTDSAYHSFPSAHTATSFGLAWPIVFGCPAAGIVALAGAALIAWASLALGAHHPSDVLVSLLLSLPIGWCVWWWVRTRGDAAWTALRSRFRRK